MKTTFYANKQETDENYCVIRMTYEELWQLRNAVGRYLGQLLIKDDKTEGEELRPVFNALYEVKYKFGVE